MQNSFTLPPNGRITKITINGVERKIDPPVPFSADDVITIPHDDIQQDIEITKAFDVLCECPPDTRTSKIRPEICPVCDKPRKYSPL